MLEDVGSIRKEDFNSGIDRNKVRRARKRVRSEHQQNDKITLLLQGIYFDGRKDKTMAQEKINNVKHKRTVIEELVVLVQEPESHYEGHFTPASVSPAAITSGIFNFLETSSISTDDVVAVGRRIARNSQWGGCFGGLGAKPPAAGGTGYWGRSPQRSKILHFFCKNNFILGLF